MRQTEDTPTPHPQELPAVQDPGRLHADPSSDDVAHHRAHAACVTGAVHGTGLHRAHAVAQAAPEIRCAKVEAARRALREGTLMLDGHVLAATLLQAARTERRHA